MNKFKSLSKKDKAEYIAIVALYPLFMLFSALGKSLKLFGTKKRQITASVLSFAMILTMLPMMSLTAFAAPATEVYVGSVVMNSTNQYAKTDVDGKVTLGGSESNYNVKFEANTGTLTLNNVTIKESSEHDMNSLTISVAIYSSGDLNLVLADGTVNTVTDNNTMSKGHSRAIFVDSSLTISGGGTLTATGGAADGNSYGIYSSSTLTISGGTTNATGGNAKHSSFGIFCQSENIVINNGTVVGVGGNASQYNSSLYVSCGIYAYKKSITINGGTVMANSTSTTGTITAMNMAPDFSGYIPAPTVTASTSTDGLSTVSYDKDNIATYKYLKIDPAPDPNYGIGVGATSVTSANEGDVLGDGTVSYNPGTNTLTLNGATVTESSAHDSVSAAIYSNGALNIVLADNTTNTITDSNPTNKSYSNGIYVAGNLTISGGGTLIVTGGTAKSSSGTSCGICTSSQLSISSGNIIARAGMVGDDPSFDGGNRYAMRYDSISYDTKIASAVGYNGTSFGEMSGCSDSGDTFKGRVAGADDQTATSIALVPKTYTVSLKDSLTDNYILYATYGRIYITAEPVAITFLCSRNTSFSFSISNTFLAVSLYEGKNTNVKTAGIKTAAVHNSEFRGKGRLVAVGGMAYNSDDNGSFGIVGDAMTINGLNVTAIGGSSQNSIGINCNSDLTLSSGTVTAIGGQASDNSSGIYCSSKLAISNGTVTAKSPSTTGTAYAMNKAPDFSAYTPTPKVTASTSADGLGTVSYNEANIATYKYLKIESSVAQPASWSELQEAINAGGKIKLTKDIVAGSGDAQLNVPSTSTVTIDLNGYKIDRNMTTATNYGSVFYIDGGNLTIADTSTNKNGQITGGKTLRFGGGVYISSGTFTMNGGSITGNTSGYGGGVYISSSGTFTMSDGSITGNTVDTGGGVYIFKGAFTMSGGSITGNTADYSGGVYISSGTFTMSGGSITDNTASYVSGVYNSEGKFYVSGSATVKDNKLTDSTPSNVCLASDRYIKVIGALTGEIDVTTAVMPTATTPITITQVSTNPEYTLTATDVANLKSDIDGYEVAMSGNAAVLQKSLGTLTKDNFTFNAPTDLTYSGAAKAATVEPNTGINCATPSIKYYDASGASVVAPTNAGTYTVKITVAENDNYAAATDLTVGTFTITQKALTEGDIDDIVTLTYTGNAIEPNVTVKVGSTTLTKNTDYTVGYSDNTNVGNATVKITGKGNYSGTVEKDFAIVYLNADGTYAFSEKGWSTTAWSNNSATITAENGYMLSKNKSAWESSLEFSNETSKNGTAVEFYVKRTSDGGLSDKLTGTCYVDKTAPTNVEIQYNNNGFKSFLNTITFGLFFNETVNVEATASDASSGIDMIQYYAADSEITNTFTITGWQNSLSLTQNSKKIVYIKVTDKAGNVTITNNEGVVVYTDSTLSSTSADFDRNNQADITIPINFNGNTIAIVCYKLELKGGSLVENTEYTVTSSSIIIKKAAIAKYLENSGIDIIIYLNPMGIEVIRTENALAKLTFRINDATHYHSGTHHDRVESTCTADGNVEYWSCSCGKCFSDEACTTPITNIILTKLGHDFTEKIVDAAHLKSAATCTSPAVYYYDCSRCDEISTTETFTDGEALGHSFGTEWQKDADNHWHSCTHDGCTETSDKSAHDWDDGEITKPATTEKKGEKTFTCKLCGATKTKAVDMLPPSMTEKTDKFVQGGETGLTFKSNAALSDLESVSVDGKVLNEKDYGKQSDSTIITLKPAFLETLSVGKHTIDIKSTTGTASAEFTIEAKVADPTKPGDTTSPQTGDSNSMILWVCLLFVSGGVLGTLGLTKKRRKQSEK